MKKIVDRSGNTVYYNKWAVVESAGMQIWLLVSEDDVDFTELLLIERGGKFYRDDRITEVVVEDVEQVEISAFEGFDLNYLEEKEVKEAE